MNRLNYYLPLGIICLLCFALHAQDAPPPVSPPNSAADSLYRNTADSGFTRDSTGQTEAARMYRSSVSSMRRDASQQIGSRDTLLRKRKMIAPEPESPKVAEPKRVDSVSSVVKKSPPDSAPPVKARVSKGAVAVAVGTCVLIGCGIAVYLFKNSKDNAAGSNNNRVPPPPDPPF